MHFSILRNIFAIASLLSILVIARSPCTYERKVRGIQHEIDTISSHSFKDANKIPLAPFASRTFFVTPNESPHKTIKVNTGVTARTVRSELVGLATFLKASVPAHTLHYIRNKNGSVTSDFLQLDRGVLARAHAREIHEFNEKCEITKITGFVHSNLICPSSTEPIENAAVFALCKKYEATKLSI